MAKFSRRSLLQAAAATTGGVVLSGGLDRMIVQAAGGKPAKLALQPVADLRDGIVRLHLPSNFQYRSFHDTDVPLPLPPIVLTDGTVLPGRHDGMGAFTGPNGNVWLVRNHEVGASAPAVAFGPGTPYDAQSGGGTTTTEVTPDGHVVQAFTSLNGTMTNCSGGVMPWGSWITCEETVNGPDVGPDFTGTSNTDAHAAARLHLRGACRWPIGPHPDHVGGTIRARSCRVQPGRGHRVSHRGQLRVPLRSVPLHPAREPDDGRPPPQRGPAPDAPGGGTDGSPPRGHPVDRGVVPGRVGRHRRPRPDVPVRPGSAGSDHQQRRAGLRRQSGSGARSCRLLPARGCLVHEGRDLLHVDPGRRRGRDRDGVDRRVRQRGRAGLVVRSSAFAVDVPLPVDVDPPTSNCPTTSRRATIEGAVLLCEDGPIENFIRRLDANGELLDVVLNRLRRNAPPNAPRFGEEFAGATFSPSGDTLFVNIQAAQGITFAIWGPWGRLGI